MSNTMLSVFLGGTCAGSAWRDDLIPRLQNVDAFNPVVPDWNEEAQAREREARATSDYVLYVITPLMQGVYSIAEVVDDSNKRPERTLFCFTSQADGDADGFDYAQYKSLKETGKLVERNGGRWLKSLDEVADFLNAEAANQGRATGRTTRLVDAYVQKLFEAKGAWVALTDHYASGANYRANKVVANLVLGRMNVEHPGVKVEINFKGGITPYARAIE